MSLYSTSSSRLFLQHSATAHSVCGRTVARLSARWLSQPETSPPTTLKMTTGKSSFLSYQPTKEGLPKVTPNRDVMTRIILRLRKRRQPPKENVCDDGVDHVQMAGSESQGCVTCLVVEITRKSKALFFFGSNQ
jgi:hypothetical protein